MNLLLVRSVSISICLGTTGCATNYMARPWPNPPSQVTTYVQGVSQLSSTLPESKVEAVFNKSQGSRIYFFARIENHSQSPINVGTENVIARDAAGNLMHVFTAEELISAANSSARLKKIVTGVAVVAGVALSVAASQTTTSGTVYTPNGPVTYYQRITDPAVAVAGSAASAAGGLVALNSINNTRNESVQFVTNNYLRTTTIWPGGAIQGFFETEIPRSGPVPRPFTLTVQVGSDSHRLAYNLSW